MPAPLIEPMQADKSELASEKPIVSRTPGEQFIPPRVETVAEGRGGMYRGMTEEESLRPRTTLDVLQDRAIREEHRMLNGGIAEFEKKYRGNPKQMQREVSKIWRNSTDYYNWRKSQGVDTEQLGDELTRYAAAQQPEMDRKFENYFFYAQEVQGLDKENALKFAEDMTAEIENETIEGGFARLYSDLQTEKGNTEEAKKARALFQRSRPQDIDFVQIYQTMSDAEKENAMVKIDRDAKTGKMMAKKLDAFGNIIEPGMKAYQVSPAEAQMYSRVFEDKVRNNLLQTTMGSVKDPDPESFNRKLRGSMDKAILEISEEYKVKNPYQVVAALAKSRKVASQAQLYASLEKQFQQEADGIIGETNNEISRDYTQKANVVAQDLVNAIGLGLGTDKGLPLPVDMTNMGSVFTMNDAKKRIASGRKIRNAVINYFEAKGVSLSEVSIENVQEFMREDMKNRSRLTTLRSDGEWKAHIGNITDDLLNQTSFDSNIMGIIAEANAEDSKGARELNDKIEFEKAQAKIKVGYQAITRSYAPWRNYQVDEPYKNAVEWLGVDEKGNFSEEWAKQYLGAEIIQSNTESGAMLKGINMPRTQNDWIANSAAAAAQAMLLSGERVVPTDESLKRYASYQQRDIVISFDNKPESYAKILSLYSRGQAASEAQLKKMQGYLSNPENARMFVESGGTAAKDVKGLFDMINQTPKLNPSRVLDADSAKTARNRAAGRLGQLVPTATASPVIQDNFKEAYSGNYTNSELFFKKNSNQTDRKYADYIDDNYRKPDRRIRSIIMADPSLAALYNLDSPDSRVDAELKKYAYGVAYNVSLELKTE